MEASPKPQEGFYDFPEPAAPIDFAAEREKFLERLDREHRLHERLDEAVIEKLNGHDWVKVRHPKSKVAYRLEPGYIGTEDLQEVEILGEVRKVKVTYLLEEVEVDGQPRKRYFGKDIAASWDPEGEAMVKQGRLEALNPDEVEVLRGIIQGSLVYDAGRDQPEGK